MMKGHTFAGVGRSCGGVQDLTANENVSNSLKRGSASRLSGKQRKMLMVSSTAKKEEKCNCRKRFRELQVESCPAVKDREEGSIALLKRARQNKSGDKHTLKTAITEVLRHAQTCTEFKPNLGETLTVPRGSITVSSLYVCACLWVCVHVCI